MSLYLTLHVGAIFGMFSFSFGKISLTVVSLGRFINSSEHLKFALCDTFVASDDRS